MVHCEDLEVRTRGRGFTEISAALAAVVTRSGIGNGLVQAFIRHTSAALVITENADGDVLGDLERYLARLVPDGDPLYRHRNEGDDDMSAHVRGVLTHVDVSVPVRGGRLALGTWQGVFLWEHRTRSLARTVCVTVHGEA